MEQIEQKELNQNTAQTQAPNQFRATPQDYLLAMAPHRTKEELQFSLGYIPIPGVIYGELQPLTEEEVQEIQELNEAKKEGQEDQPQPEPEVVTETKKKRGKGSRPKKSESTSSE